MATPTTPHAVTAKPQRWTGTASLLLVSLIGLIAFVSPFWSANLRQSGDLSRTSESPLLIALISGICLFMLFANLGSGMSSKSVALLGVLISINAVLRFVDQSFFIPGEFSPIFLLIMLVGYSFGAELGFLMGALTLLVSAIITGGIGPWLPFQMFAAGWVGMFAAWLPRLAPIEQPRRAVIALTIYGFASGLFYGLVMNLYNWDSLADGGWLPGTSMGEVITRYFTFYVATSLGFDLVRAFGNVILILALGLPLLSMFRRFRQRFSFQVVTSTVTDAKPSSATLS